MLRCFTVLAFLLALLPLAAQQYFPIKVDQKWGLINAEGEIVQEPVYDAIGEFKRFGYAVMQRDGRVGLLGQNGTEVLLPRYEDLKVLDSTLVAVMDEGDWMVVNLRGKVVLDKGYERVRVWKSRYLAYLKNGKWGLRNKFGQELTPPVYDDIQYEEGGFFLTNRDQRLGLLSGTGREILPNQAEEIRFHSDSLFFYRQGRLWGAVDFYGIEEIPLAYQSYQTVATGYIKLRNEKAQHLYSLACKRVLKRHAFDDFYPFSPRYIIVKRSRQLGLMNWCGNLILPPVYDEIQAYDQGLFRVSKDARWGVVDHTGEVIIPFEYDYIAPLRQQLCVVKRAGAFGIANVRGEEVVPPSYNRIELDGDRARAYRDKQGEEQLTLLQFNDNGQLRDSSELGQHFQITVAGTKNGRAGKAEGKDKSSYVLQSFEWFYSPEEDRWGLRRLSDGEVQIDAKFSYVQVERELGFTIVGIQQSATYDFERTTFRFDMIYGLVNNELGLLVTELEFWDIRHEDFASGLPVARCVFSSGKHGLIDRSGRVIRSDMTYVGNFVNGVARFSFTGQLSGDLKPDYTLGKLSSYLRALKAPSVMTDYTQYDQDFRREASLVCKGCEWGYIDSIGKVVVPPEYTFVKDFVNEVGMISCNGKWGMVNRDAKMVIPCEYDGIQFMENTGNKMVRVYRRAPKYGLVDTLGQLKVSAAYDEIGNYSEGRLAVRRNDLWGFVNVDGLEVIPCRFREVRNFNEGLAAVRLGSGWGFVDKQGRIAIDFQYSRTGSFHNGLAWVHTPDGVGYINQAGQFLIPPHFDRGFDFQQGVARVQHNREYGLINTQGQYLQRPRFTEISPFNPHGLAIAQYGNHNLRYGLIDRRGQLVGRSAFQEIRPFREGMAAVRHKGEWGFVDTTGQLTIPCRFSKVSDFSEGMAAVQRDGECGYIDQTGRLLIPCSYSKCLDFSGGKAVVYQGLRKAGLVNKAGELLIEPSVNRLINFQEGRGLVRDEQYRFYYITEQASPYDGYYDQATEFQHGVAVVQINGKWGIINQKGIEIIPPKYDKIEQFENGYAKVRIQGFNGLASLQGELIVDPRYEYISYAGEGLFRVEKGNEVGYFDVNGEWIWQLDR